MGLLGPDDTARLLAAYGVSEAYGRATFLAFGQALQAAAGSISSGGGGALQAAAGSGSSSGGDMQQPPGLAQRFEDSDDSNDPDHQTSPYSLRQAAERLKNDGIF
jgi:hypothetical protein